MVVGVDEIEYRYLMNGVVALSSYSLRALSGCFRRLQMAESYEYTKILAKIELHFSNLPSD